MLTGCMMVQPSKKTEILIMILRPYQAQNIAELRKMYASGKKRLIYQLATGGGKTAVFSEIARLSASIGNRVLIITDRQELHQQGGDALSRIGVSYREITAKTKVLPSSMVCVAMVETLKRRMHRPDYGDFIKSFNLIIIDECHIQAFSKLFEVLVETQLVLGVSATPIRTGKMRELKEDYDGMVRGPEICSLINGGFLVPAVHFGIEVDLSSVRITAGEYNEGDQGKVYSEKKLYGGVVENWKLRAEGRKTLAFCATVQNSVELCEEFNGAGIPSVHVDGTTPEDERKKAFADFKSGIYTVLCNCGIATKGYDCPEVSCIVLYRATMSLPLYLQMIGRGSRKHDVSGKKNFVILDFGQNHRHGFYDSPRCWTLENPKKKKKLDVAPVKTCPACEALVPPQTRICPYCGYEWQKSLKEMDEERIVVMLKELTPSQVQRYADTATVEELEIIQKEKGYSPAWVWHKLRTVDEFVALERARGYKRGWALKKASELLKLDITWSDCYDKKD